MSLERFVKPRSIAVFGGGYQAQEVIRQMRPHGVRRVRSGRSIPRRRRSWGEGSTVQWKTSREARTAAYGRCQSQPHHRHCQRSRRQGVRGGAICYATGFHRSRAKRAPSSRGQLLEASGRDASDRAELLRAPPTISTAPCFGPTSRAAGGWMKGWPSS